MTALRQRETLTSQLVKALTERIRAGELKPGDRLPTEQELIEEFKVSRTVVREAISSLQRRRPGRDPAGRRRLRAAGRVRAAVPHRQRQSQSAART